jgi:hypothetical protein
VGEASVFDLKLEPVARDDNGRLNCLIEIDAASLVVLVSGGGIYFHDRRKAETGSRLERDCFDGARSVELVDAPLRGSSGG